MLICVCLMLSLLACADSGSGETTGQTEPTNSESTIQETIMQTAPTTTPTLPPPPPEEEEEEDSLHDIQVDENGNLIGSGSSGGASGGGFSGSGSEAIVADPHTWYKKFQSLPVASSSMSQIELRKLCLEYFRLQLSFVWTPNKAISFKSSEGKRISLPKGMAYSGMLYANGDSRGGGNIYKMLNYYDTKTGMLDVAAMGDNIFNILSSHCSWGASWAWARVSNDAKLYTMTDYVPSEGKILLVGPYTYDESEWAAHGDATDKIIKKNGEQVMYQSYANMKIADGLYSSSAYHVIMCSVDPVIVKNPDGTINGEESYISFCDQNAYGTIGALDLTFQSNGMPLQTLGGVDTKATFRWLMDHGYLPFTIPEFVGKAKVEAGDAYVGKLKNGADITLEKLAKEKIRANYAISNVRITVKDSSGKVLLTQNPAIFTRNNTFAIDLSKALDTNALSGLANGSNTIHISACLSTGQWIEAFYTTLKM